jgi:hypothetical protein
MVMWPRILPIYPIFIFAVLVVPAEYTVPNYPDLTVKTRFTSNEDISQSRTLYLKGARERNETVNEHPSIRSGDLDFANILQCDNRQRISLNQRDKIYHVSPIQDRSELLKNARPISPPITFGATVKVTIDSVDTGERRQFAHNIARHVKVKTVDQPSPGASTPASVELTDGWYLDLPNNQCAGQRRGFARLVAGSAGQPFDQFQIAWIGKAARGYPIEETSVKTAANGTTSTKIELLELSEVAIDPSLFEVPIGYEKALQTGYGGADLTKADTIANRLQYYWNVFSSWVRGYLG